MPERAIWPRRALLAGAAAAIARRSAAQTRFPDRFLRLIVPYAPASGAPDLHARLFAAALEARLGQRIVADNRPGAGGTIGAALAARAPADGYNLLWAAGSLFECNPYLYRHIQYRLEDFQPVGAFSEATFMLYVRPGLGPRDLPTLLALMRRRPGEIRYGNGGRGSQLHLTWERLQRLAGVQALEVPFPASGVQPAMLSGDVDFNCSVLDDGMLQHFAAGTLVPIAVTAAERVPRLPAIGTVAEAGFPGFTATGGYSVFAPKDVPPDILAKLRDACDAVTADPALEQRLRQLVAWVPAYRRAADYAVWLRQDREVWRRIIDETGITLD